MLEFKHIPDQPELDGGSILFLPDDSLRLLEDEYWAELGQAIDEGWKTPDEATQEFLAWRAGYRAVESVILGDITKE
jgi:hypothetical protein